MFLCCVFPVFGMLCARVFSSSCFFGGVLHSINGCTPQTPLYCIGNNITSTHHFEQPAKLGFCSLDAVKTGKNVKFVTVISVVSNFQLNSNNICFMNKIFAVYSPLYSILHFYPVCVTTWKSSYWLFLLYYSMIFIKL